MFVCSTDLIWFLWLDHSVNSLLRFHKNISEISVIGESLYLLRLSHLILLSLNSPPCKSLRSKLPPEEPHRNSPLRANSSLLSFLLLYKSPNAQVAVPEILGTLKSNTARSQWLYGATGTSSSVATKSLATIDKLLTSSGIRDDW